MKWSILEFLLVPKNQKIVKTCCLLRETSVLFRSASRRSIIASCLCGRNTSIHQISIYLHFHLSPFAAVQQMYLKHQISICLHPHCRLLLLENNLPFSRSLGCSWKSYAYCLVACFVISWISTMLSPHESHLVSILWMVSVPKLSDVLGCAPDTKWGL